MAHQPIGGERVIPSREGNKEGNNTVLPFFFLETRAYPDWESVRLTGGSLDRDGAL